MNLAAVLAAAERCAAAYETTPEASRGAFEALGQEWVGLYQAEGLQAALSLRDGSGYLNISGTRFGRDGELGDFLKDLDVEALDIGGGAKVAKGAFEGLFKLWQWVYESLPSAAAIWVEGHSLGAWRAYYSPLFCPEARLAGLYCFEPLKAGNQAFWDRYDRADTVAVVNGGDMFFSYPFVDGWEAKHPDHDHLWLHGGGVDVIQPADWPGGLSLNDHYIPAVVSALRALVQE